MRTPSRPSPRRALRAALLTLAVLPLLAACAARRAPLGLPAGHPADADLPGIAVLGAHTEHAAPVAAAPAAPANDEKEEKPAKYVCPMHADVVSDAPGKCPKCGMALRLVKDKAAPAEHGDHR